MTKKHTKSTPNPLGEWAAWTEHGDYQRLAQLIRKPHPRHATERYTADYVRKVLLGLRSNAMILNTAKKYLKQKKQLMERMSK
ncbi:MAG: hypothetical protein AAFQ98_10425 [Bacteroidota bacterium]